MAKAKNMVIVESPAKVKTISRYLGDDYIVTSSMGHVRDLPPKKLGVDVNDNFKPTYQLVSDRLEMVKNLKKIASKAKSVYLATDLDREGEAIAWHLIEALEIPPEKVRRVTFSEITERAIIAAFEHPRSIDINKVNAQQARRVLDRIVGYKLSPLLWRKIARGLSAGRVQSVAVRLICEREKEIQAFKPEEFWRIIAKVIPEGTPARDRDIFEIELKKVNGKKADLKNEQQTMEVVEKIKAQPFVIAKVETKTLSSSPPPPLITSTLQQQASIQLRFSTRKTMRLAQELYQGIELGEEGPVGLITYMRTDSVRIADEAMADCRKQVKKQFGSDYLASNPRRFRSGKRAQDAHEAIRPTYVERTPDDLQGQLSKDQHLLYRLIWNRFVATQLANAKIEVTDVSVAAGDAILQAKGRRILFDGHLKLTPANGKEQILPELKEGQELELVELTPSQHFTKPPPRYNEATLVRTLEKEGIGRPSTYSSIISTIQQRNYVKQAERRFHATELGMVVNDRLVEHFSKLLDMKFTSEMEDELDKIEEEHLDWVQVLDSFYEDFSADLERAGEKMVKFTQMSDETCEKCGKQMAVKLTSRGKFLACVGYPECKTTKPLGDDGNERPRPLPTDYTCEKCDSPMVIRTGRRGKFMACSAFPKCRNTVSIDDDGKPVKPQKSGEKCEKCGSDMIIRRSRRGKFLACGAFPKCRNTRPLPDAERREAQETGIPCKECGRPMLVRFGRRGPFLACSGYPKCGTTANVPDDLEVKVPE